MVLGLQRCLVCLVGFLKAAQWHLFLIHRKQDWAVETGSVLGQKTML